MLKVGCQTYTWEMLGDGWKGRVDDILDAVAQAEYQGIEITNSMIREYAVRPADFAKAIKDRGLKLAAFAYASPAGLTDPAARGGELNGADEALRFVAHFPGVVLALGGASTPRLARAGVRRRVVVGDLRRARGGTGALEQRSGRLLCTEALARCALRSRRGQFRRLFGAELQPRTDRGRTGTCRRRGCDRCVPRFDRRHGPALGT